METFQKGMKTVVSGTMLTGLDVTGAARLETPMGRGLQAGQSPHGMGFSGRHGCAFHLPGNGPSRREYTYLRRTGASDTATASSPERIRDRAGLHESLFSNGSLPGGNTPFPEGVLLSRRECHERKLVHQRESSRECLLPGRDCAFPEGNGALPVNPLSLARGARSLLTREDTRRPERWQPPAIAINGGPRSARCQPSMCRGSQFTMSGTK